MKAVKAVRPVKGSIESGRFRVPYRVYGDAPRALIGVSGALQTMAVWAAFVRRFSQDFTCVIFDMPGIGRSEILSGGARVTVEEQVEVVRDLIAATAPGKPVSLAGSSWGTVVAVAHAALYPSEVQQLLIGSFGMKPNDTMMGVIERADALYQSGKWEEGADLIIEVFGQQINPQYRRSVVAQFAELSQANADAFHEHCKNIISIGRLENVLDLRDITARTMIVNGADDTILDLNDMHEAAELIADCQTVLVEGAGHFLHFEKPEILELYAEFLNQKPAAVTATAG